MQASLIIPMITPFKDNHLDRKALNRFVEYAKANRYDGLFAGGSTGGFASLSFEQHQQFLEWVMEAAQGMELYAGITRSSIIETLHMGKIASDLGYSNLVAINPFYHRYSQDSVYRFFDSILDAFDADVYAYNNPGLSGTEILPETIRKLKENHENLIGLKDSGADMAKFREFLKIRGLKVFQGKDALLLDSIREGAHGGVCMSSNFCLNTLKIARGSHDAERISEITGELVKLVTSYETPTIHNYLFRKYIAGESKPKNYMNMPFADLKELPPDEKLRALMILE